MSPRATAAEAVATELSSRKVETAASRSQLWLSRKKMASSLEEEAISQKELIRVSCWSLDSWDSVSMAACFLACLGRRLALREWMNLDCFRRETFVLYPW